MAIPSGSGTEVLKFSRFLAMDNTEQTLITGVANHIYTVISIICNAKSAGTSTVTCRLMVGSSAAQHLFYQDILQNQTYVFNDKFVISGAYNLKMYATSGDDVDVVCSFIDQDWT